MMELFARLFEFIAVVWLVRFLFRSVFGGGIHAQTFRQSGMGGPFQPSGHPSSEPRVISGEMKKDPQCGTYVSTELSLKTPSGNEVLHFCSRRCQEEFLQAHSSKPA